MKTNDSAPGNQCDKKTITETHEQLKDDFLMSWRYNDWKCQWVENRATILPLDPKIMEKLIRWKEKVHTYTQRIGEHERGFLMTWGKSGLVQQDTVLISRMNISRGKWEFKQYFLNKGSPNRQGGRVCEDGKDCRVFYISSIFKICLFFILPSYLWLFIPFVKK